MEFSSGQLLNLKNKRGFLLGLLILVSLIFILFVWQTRHHYSPHLGYQKIVSENRVVILENWELKFFKCSDQYFNDGCQDTGDFVASFKMPAPDKTKSLLKNLSNVPSHVQLVALIPEESFSQLLPYSHLMLYMPRMVQRNTSVRIGDITHLLSGLGKNLTIHIPTESLRKDKKIILSFFISGLPWFGPADMPIALGEPSAILDYARLADQNTLTGNVGRALEFSTRLLVSAMAFMLDHSASFLYLSVYALLRGFRDFVPFMVEAGWIKSHHLFELIFVPLINGLLIFTMLLFLASMFGLRFKKKNSLVVLGLSILSIVLLQFFTSEKSFWTTADLYTDIISSVMGFALVVYAAISYFRNRNKAEKIRKKLVIKPQVFVFQCIILMLALGVHGYSNWSDLNQIQVGYFKDLLDWRQYILFYSMIVVALIEVGSTSKAMLTFGSKMAAQATMEKDLDIGRQVQREMLPIRKKTSALWGWRTFYYPATQLAGDWFDVREITHVGGGSTLIACLADVTGHGVGAAMMTSTISSHWGLWAQTLANQTKPGSPEEITLALHQGIFNIEKGLNAMRSSLGATAAVVLIDCENMLMGYATPGHPGVILERNQSMIYLTSPGKRFGAEDFNAEIKVQPIQIGDLIHLFTDGILPPKEMLSRWLMNIKKRITQNQNYFSKIVLKGMQANRKLFRGDSSLEDDMTLVTIFIKG